MPPRRPEDAPETLDDSEVFWRDLQPWLKDCGYQLRRRYRPGWVPAWTQRKTSLYWWEFEDSVKARHPSVMDAKTSDGTPVILKRIRISEHPVEVDITQYLGTIVDKKNHSPPLKEVLVCPNNQDLKILVFPLLRRFDDPDFATIGEVVEFFRQIFEAVQFLHHQHIAHRDVCVLNILMDTSMFPGGYHPAAPSMTRDFKNKVKPTPRTLSTPRYYLIDFGLSVRYEDSENLTARPVRGQDKTAPEFVHGLDGSYNPFPTDIYYLGNFIQEHFFDGKDDVKAKRGLEFMKSLVETMCSAEPHGRPQIDEVVSRFDGLWKALPISKLQSRLKSKGESSWQSLTLGISHWVQKMKYTMSHIPPVPAASR